ncbi:ATP-binding cassette domain-containing protein, partial [Bacteroides ovatus]
YPTSDKYVLKNLDFTFEKGKKYIIIGESGTGKSTIFKILQKQEIATEGEVQLNNRNILNITDSIYYSKVGFATQDTGIFTASIKDNISLFDNKPVDKTIIEQLGLNTLINSKPKGIDTVISSEDKSISGGEKQRIAIGRAILKDSKIIIMDEASASIDPDNEFELQKAFKNLMKDKTVIMIAHRLSTIKDLDEILVMDSGKIIERGSDKKLMSRDTSYKRLQEMFNSANEWRVSNEGVL